VAQERRPAKGVVEVETRVRFPETDRYDVAHNSCYFTWFELARIEYLRACGLAIRDFDAAGILIPLRECSAKLVAPVRYDDEIVIRGRLVELTPIKIAFEYEIVAKDDGRVLATGATVNVSVNASGKITKMPGHLLEAMRREA
jgi:acyl-CoA thioester hydrolase